MEQLGLYTRVPELKIIFLDDSNKNIARKKEEAMPRFHIKGKGHSYLKMAKTVKCLTQTDMPGTLRKTTRHQCYKTFFSSPPIVG